MSRADYYLYILKCSDNSLYTGIAIDVKKRISQHNGETTGGSKYVRSRRPAVLVYFEKCNSRQEASRREFEIKKMTRTQKEKLIDKVLINKSDII